MLTDAVAAYWAGRKEYLFFEAKFEILCGVIAILGIGAVWIATVLIVHRCEQRDKEKEEKKSAKRWWKDEQV